jgi:hypothetical protein
MNVLLLKIRDLRVDLLSSENMRIFFDFGKQIAI